MRHLHPLALIPALLAVALVTQAGSCTQQNPATGIAAAEVALTAADQVAIQYVTLPLCGPTAPKLCSVAATSTQIKSAAEAAFNAVQAAKASPTNATLAAANAAVAALQSLLPTTTGG